MGKNKKTRDLERSVYRDTRTVDLMDEFECLNKKDGKPYDRLIITGFKGLAEFGRFRCKYIIKRMKYEDETIGDITFTQLKNNRSGKLKNYVTEQINSKTKDWNGEQEIELELDTPYLLRAQNSRNRTGYGWEWDWTDGIGTYIEGTEYGETTRYGIVAVKVSRCFGC